MDKSDLVQTDNSADSGSQRSAGAFGKRVVLGFLLFWIVVVIAIFVFRYPFIISQLAGGGEDRALLAIVSAEFTGGLLEIEFIRSVPDQPAAVFVVGGHLPRHSSSSNPELANNFNGNTLAFNGEQYEILFEAADPQRLPGREGGLEIDWQDKRRGLISLDLTGSFAAEEISANRAFLVLARTDSDFRTAAILNN